MKSPDQHISRRDFFKKASYGIAGMTAGAAAGATIVHSCKHDPMVNANDRKIENVPINPNDNSTNRGNNSSAQGMLPTRMLGATGLEVSMLSFGGGSQFIRNVNGDWEPLLERAIEMGVNYFDTSEDYAGGRSEERYGELLSPIRDQVYIATKFNGLKNGKRNADAMMQEFETSLSRLKTDYVDVLLIHAINDSDSVSDIENTVYNKMQQLKENGSVRFLGFSSMDSAQRSKELIEQLEFDVALLAINPTNYGNYAQVALPAAREKNTGVLAMKVMRDIVGQSATAEELMRYALSLDGVSSNCIGHYGQHILEENVDLVKNIGPTSIRKESKALEMRLRYLAGPHALCWARPGYKDNGYA